MTTMTDRDIIAWVRRYALYCEKTGSPVSAENYRRLADLAEKGAKEPEGPFWAFGYTDKTGTIIFDCCQEADFASDASELLGGDAPIGLWYWEGTLRGFECPGGDYDCEAVGKFTLTTAKNAKNGEAP